MSVLLSAGIILVLSASIFVLYKWGDAKVIGVTPVKTFTFIAILFTSSLDVGLIMLPLTEFKDYANIEFSPEYGFSNPLAIEFGFWGFLIWIFYFLSCFYFCVIEPRVKFFEKPAVKIINNVVIVSTCAFTAYLLLSNLPWYLPTAGDGQSIIPEFYLIIFSVIAISVYSSTNIHYLKILSIATTWLFVCLIILIWSLEYIFAETSLSTFFNHLILLGGYFTHIEQFVLPINSHHEFYLFWWFAWSIMIGQFTSRFVGGLNTYQLLGAMLIFPSIPIAAWFTVLYHFHETNTSVQGLVNFAMVTVGIVFVINSLDSLIRLYTDNLNLTVQRLGKSRYISFNIIALSLLTLLFQLDFLEIQWIGAIVIGLFFFCFIFIIKEKLNIVRKITGSPTENSLDFNKIERVI